MGDIWDGSAAVTSGTHFPLRLGGSGDLPLGAFQSLSRWKQIPKYVSAALGHAAVQGESFQAGGSWDSRRLHQRVPLCHQGGLGSPLGLGAPDILKNENILTQGIKKWYLF